MRSRTTGHNKEGKSSQNKPKTDTNGTISRCDRDHILSVRRAKQRHGSEGTNQMEFLDANLTTTEMKICGCSAEGTAAEHTAKEAKEKEF